MQTNKIPICKICGGPHYKTFCFQAERKPMAIRKPLKASAPPKRSGMSMYRQKPRKPLRRAYMASESKNERSILVRKLDRIFSVYIRRKDALGVTARCVTCGATGHWQNMQNGHFIPRRKMNLRWDELNCHVQCSYCNETLQGNLGKYETYIVNKYGEEVLNNLKAKSKQIEKIQIFQIQELIEVYENKLLGLTST